MKLSEFLCKTFAEPKSRVQEAGQAVLEYILVLIITVSLILGILYQFNDAFKNFLDSYFGDYIACLLETGELPSLGGSGPNQADCVSPFRQFSLESGTSLKPSGSDGQGSTGGNGGGSTGDALGGNSPGSRLRPSVVTAGGSASNAENSTGINSSRSGRQTYRGSQQGANLAEGFSGENGDGTSGGRQGRTIIRRRYIDLGEKYLSDAEKRKKDRLEAASQKVKKKGQGSQLRAARFPLTLPKQRAVASEVDSKGFNFAMILRFLVIAGILIALFIFLGGQAMQIKKSWQKSE